MEEWKVAYGANTNQVMSHKEVDSLIVETMKTKSPQIEKAGKSKPVIKTIAVPPPKIKEQPFKSLKATLRSNDKNNVPFAHLRKGNK